jgi:hypothetical protein
VTVVYRAEYIWIDGTEPTPLLRSKTKILADGAEPGIWGFDGSSTNQAPGHASDCVLNPVKIVPDPIRGGDDVLVLCEVLLTDMTPHPTNTRALLSSVAEQFAAFRGQRLIPSMLSRRGLPLALARLETPDETPLVDLDDPAVLKRERLRPSRVATRERSITQQLALKLFRKYPRTAGLRWWSVWESQWANVTLFDRALPRLRLAQVDELTLAHPAVQEAADWFGLRPVK